MKIGRGFLILIIFFSLLQACGIKKNVSADSIFRHINLGAYGRIELGQNLESKKNLIIENNNQYLLKDGIFGGAKSIELIKNDNGLIKEFVFEYDESVTLESQISSYREDFGSPIMKSGKAIWNDGKTQFEIYSEIVNERETTFSKIVDLNNKN